MNKKEIAHALKDYPAALNVDEVAKILRVSTKTVYKLIDESSLPAVKVGRAYRIAKGEVVNFLRQRDKKCLNPKCVANENSDKYVWTIERTCDIIRLPNKNNKKGTKSNGNKNITRCKCAV